MKGKIIYFGEEWQLTSKSKQGKKLPDNFDVKLSPVTKGVGVRTNESKLVIIHYKDGCKVVHRALTRAQCRKIVPNYTRLEYK
jgi:hypothetical protein